MTIWARLKDKLALRALTILDCTLRDGGYYNNWDFDLDTVRRYMSATPRPESMLSKSDFDLHRRTVSWGVCLFLDEFLRRLWNVNGPALGVMVNASDLLSYSLGPRAAVDSLFAPKPESPVKIVRIAAHLREIEGCENPSVA